jgi:hypothetical protein
VGFFHFFFPWGVILQALAIAHFIRRRPDGYWLWVIIFLGPLGALVYIAIEAVPDLGLLRHALDGVARRRRIGQLEAVVKENPSTGNYEELGDLHLDERHYARARECYDRAISPRTDHPDPVYRRAIAAIHLGDFDAAVADLEAVTGRDPKYDFNRAIGLLGHAYARAGQPEKADACFQQALAASTLNETSLNYAAFLAARGRVEEARVLAEQVLARKTTMPRYLQRRERHWFRQARALLKRLPAARAVAAERGLTGTK